MRNENIWLFYNMIVIKEVEYRLANSTLKCDNAEVGKAMLLAGSWDEVRDRLVRTLVYKLDLTRPDEITEKNTIKGYNRTLKYSNGLELQFHDGLITWVFSRYVGDYLRRFRAKVGLIGK